MLREIYECDTNPTRQPNREQCTLRPMVIYRQTREKSHHYSTHATAHLSAMKKHAIHLLEAHKTIRLPSLRTKRLDARSRQLPSQQPKSNQVGATSSQRRLPQPQHTPTASSRLRQLHELLRPQHSPGCCNVRGMDAKQAKPVVGCRKGCTVSARRLQEDWETCRLPKTPSTDVPFSLTWLV